MQAADIPGAPPRVPLIPKEAALVLAGSCAGAFTKTAVAPLERIKILMQVQALSLEAQAKIKSAGDKKGIVEGVNARYTGSFQGFYRIVKEEGFLALYKGNLANIIRVIPNYGLKFGFNDIIKDAVLKPGQKVSDLTFMQLMVSGTAAGLIQIFGTYPLEVIRTRISLSQGFGVKYRGIIDCFVQTVKKEGYGAMFKGIGPTILSGAPYVGLQMSFYQLFKNYSPEHLRDQTWYNLCGGALSGLTAQMIAYPGDTVRRRMQTNGMGGTERAYKNSWDCSMKILRREGVRGFYLGAGANAFRALPGAAIQFSSYDFFKKFFSDL